MYNTVIYLKNKKNVMFYRIPSAQDGGGTAQTTPRLRASMPGPLSALSLFLYIYIYMYI